MNKDEIRQLIDTDPDAVCDLVLALQRDVNTLKEQVAELLNRLKKDSHNSSKPPSSDHPGRKPRSLRKSSGKKTGGQKGHLGSTLSLAEEPDEVIAHDPKQCCECGGFLDAAAKVVTERRQEFDIPPPRLLCTEHQTRSCICPHCHSLNQGAFPEGITGPVQYGARIKSALVSLVMQHLVPYNRAHEFLADLYGQAPSEGTLNRAIKTCHQTLEPVEKEIKAAITRSSVVSYDETGGRIQTKLHWFHVACTKTLTFYQSHARRGCEAMDALDILPHFTGKAVHDRWKPYHKYDKATHFFCCAHLLRDLCSVFETTRQTWTQRMSSLLRAALRIKEQAVSQNKTSLDKGELNRMKLLYQKIIRLGRARNPVPEKTGRRGRTKKSEALNLLEFFNANLSGVLGFVLDFEVPFDNNQAERDVRMLKVKQKVSGCFRSEDGAKEFCRIRGYLSSLRKQKMNIMEGLESVFRSSPIKPCLTT